MRKLTPKQQRFVDEYLVDLNATQAAARAGYSKKTAASQGERLLRNVEVSALLAEAFKRRSERTAIQADDVLREWSTIATADPGELIRYRVRACRHCHGKGHRYQWVSEAEFIEALEAAKAATPEGKRPKLPDDAGGYGYSVHLKPVMDCHHCLGDGITDVLIPDTATLTPAARKLYAGVKQTKEGIEVKMRDQDGALLNIARHLGMMIERKEVSGPGGGPVQTVGIQTTDPMEAAKAYQDIMAGKR